MSTASTQSPVSISQSNAPLRWRSWPVRDDWRLAVAVALLLVGVGLIVSRFGGDGLSIGVGVGALAVALWRLFVPADFEIDEEGVWRDVFGWHSCMSWRDVRRYTTGRDGVVLLPDDDRSPLVYVRGMVVPWGMHREAVVRAIDLRLAKGRESKTTLQEASGS